MNGSYREDGELTPRLYVVLAATARGETAKETAFRLGTDHRTVTRQRAVIVSRLGARTLPHAVAIAVTRGILSVDEC